MWLIIVPSGKERAVIHRKKYRRRGKDTERLKKAVKDKAVSSSNPTYVAPNALYVIIVPQKPLCDIQHDPYMIS